MSCNCYSSTSSYIYAPAGHIVTGNLGIIKDKHVRKLLTKGPTYREQNNIEMKKYAWRQLGNIELNGQRMKI